MDAWNVLENCIEDSAYGGYGKTSGLQLTFYLNTESLTIDIQAIDAERKTWLKLQRNILFLKKLRIRNV